MAVKKINFILSATPSLKYFNLMEGLEELILTDPNSTMIPSLKIPSSVKTCSLTNIYFYDLTFEGGNGSITNMYQLNLTMTECTVMNRLICERQLATNSNIQRSIPSTDGVINYLRVDYSFLTKLSDTNTFGEVIIIDSQDHQEVFNYSNRTTLFLTGYQRGDGYPALRLNLHFKVIHNLIGENHSYYTGLSADRWIE